MNGSDEEIGADGTLPRNAQPEDINRDPAIYTKTDVPGFVSELQRQKRQRWEEAHAERKRDEKVAFLTGEGEDGIERQLGRVQETLDAMLRRLPPEELEALLVAVRGY